MTRRDLIAAVAGGAIVTVLAGGVAWAGIPGDGGVIQGCYDGGGNVKVVAALPCPKGYTPLAWNQQGAKGDDGAPGAPGEQGVPGAPGADGASVTSQALSSGDANCPDGGSAFTSATGTTYACNGASGSSGAPWDIVTTAIGTLAPGTNVQFIVPCPAGDIVLGGTFDQPFSAPSTSAPTAAGTGWRYTVDNGAGSTAVGPLTMHTYCGKS